MTELKLKTPSKRLKDAIHNVRLGFTKLEDAVGKALEIGRVEGFTDKEIGDMIRMEMLEAGYTTRTITNVLPDSAKNKRMARPNLHLKKKLPQLTSDMVEDDAPTGYYQGEANEYDIKIVEQYDRPYLIKVVKYLDDIIDTLNKDAHKWDAKMDKVTKENKELKEEVAKLKEQLLKK